jgi:hypothetical protein
MPILAIFVPAEAEAVRNSTLTLCQSPLFFAPRPCCSMLGFAVPLGGMKQSQTRGFCRIVEHAVERKSRQKEL